MNRGFEGLSDGANEQMKIVQYVPRKFAAAGGPRTLEHCRLARLGLAQEEQPVRPPSPLLVGRAFCERLVDAVRTGLGCLLGPDSVSLLLWCLVWGRRGDVGERVIGVDGHGDVGGGRVRNRSRAGVLAGQGVSRPSVKEGSRDVGEMQRDAGEIEEKEE